MYGLVPRRSPQVEALVVVLAYLVYDSSRGLVAGGRGIALAHARTVWSAERTLHLDAERWAQATARHMPGLLAAFGASYMTLHLGATVLALVWLYRRRDARAYATVRTALLVASGLGLIGFVLFPTAPPRLAGLGVADTVSNGPVGLNGSLRWLYNPFAAMPSMHLAFAVLVGAAVFRYARRRAWRGVAVAYPLWVTAEVVATGNHFVLDGVAGALVAAVSLIVGDAAVRRLPAYRTASQPHGAAGREPRPTGLAA